MRAGEEDQRECDSLGEVPSAEVLTGKRVEGHFRRREGDTIENQ
jgi:hypothetical protein